MVKGSPCLGCEKRRAEHGYNCHSDCPEYKEWHDEQVAEREIISKKRAAEDMIVSIRTNAAYKQKKKKANVKYWKG